MARLCEFIMLIPGSKEGMGALKEELLTSMEYEKIARVVKEQKRSSCWVNP